MHKNVEKCLLVRHNQTLPVVTFRVSGRPRYVTCKQELLVFRAITAFRSESDDSESDLKTMPHLGVVHNCHHFHEHTQRTLGGGEGVKGDRTLF